MTTRPLLASATSRIEVLDNDYNRDEEAVA